MTDGTGADQIDYTYNPIDQTLFAPQQSPGPLYPSTLDTIDGASGTRFDYTPPPDNSFTHPFTRPLNSEWELSPGPLTSHALSIVAWFRCDSRAFLTSSTFGILSAPGAYDLRVDTVSQKLKFTIDPGIALEFPATVAADSWHLAVAVINQDHTVIKLSLDGAPFISTGIFGVGSPVSAIAVGELVSGGTVPFEQSWWLTNIRTTKCDELTDDMVLSMYWGGP